MFKLCEEDVITHSIKGLLEVNENREIDLSVIQGFENIFRKMQKRMLDAVFGSESKLVLGENITSISKASELEADN